MNKKFAKSFLDENKKIQKVLQVINQVDVVFYKQPTKLLIDTLSKDKKFKVKSHGVEASMIVIRK